MEKIKAFIPNRQIHIIDFEVFNHLWLCVILCLDTMVKTIIVNDPLKLKNYYDEHKNDIFVGFNIKGYDQFILRFLVLAALNHNRPSNPKDLSDWIIVCKQDGWKYNDGFGNPGNGCPNEFWKIKINIYDVNSSFKDKMALKQLEGYRGISIEECSVDFNLDRELSVVEIATVVKYCIHDVEATAFTFLKKKIFEDFKSHYLLASEYCGDNFDKAIRATGSMLTAMVLKAERKEERTDGWDFIWPTDKLRLNKYAFVEVFFKDIRHSKNIDAQLSIIIGDTEVVFGLGGLHASKRNFICNNGKFLNFDVSSYYPSIMLLFDLLSRNIPEGSTVFKDIYERRIALKKEQLAAEAAGDFDTAKKKKSEQLPYKLFLNKCFGASGGKVDRGNALYDLRNQRSVCVTGQLLLLDLLEKIEDKCRIVQANTDGILVQILNDNVDEIRSIYTEWSERTGAKLEEDLYVKVFQKGVNDYIAISASGEIKGKGSDAKDKNDLDNDVPILSEALRAYYDKDIPVEETINNCDKLIKFQQICHAGSLCEFAMLGDAVLPDGSNILPNKTNRVFASKDLSTPCICHRYGSRAKKPGQIKKASKSPNHIFINNGDVRNLPVPDELDRDFYIQAVNDAIKRYEIPDPKNTAAFEIAKAVTEAALAAPNPEEGYRAAVAKKAELHSFGQKFY